MELFHFFLNNRDEVLQLTGQHLGLVVISIAIAALIGIPAGILMTRRPNLEKAILGFANIVQTIPSLALFGFLIHVSGIGSDTVVCALVLYGLLPIIKNTYAGIRGVDASVREAGRGMGMTDQELLRQVEIPLALGVILAGIRIAAITSVGVATIAAAIGAGGLGMYIFRGLASVNTTLILAGAIPAAALALLADLGLGWMEKLLTPAQSRVPQVERRAV